jgi:hypothetical protein
MTQYVIELVGIPKHYLQLTHNSNKHGKIVSGDKTWNKKGLTALAVSGQICALAERQGSGSNFPEGSTQLCLSHSLTSKTKHKTHPTLSSGRNFGTQEPALITSCCA